MRRNRGRKKRKQQLISNIIHNLFICYVVENFAWTNEKLSNEGENDRNKKRKKRIEELSNDIRPVKNFSIGVANLIVLPKN